MDTSPHSKELFLATLLLKLYHDTVTGVVTVKDSRRTMKIFLQRGHIVYADGIDKDTAFLREIASKRDLDQPQVDDLRLIQEKDPHSLGRVLIEKKLITQAVWNRFLEWKVKAVLAAAFEMENAEVGFSKIDLDIPAVNFVDCNMLQLLLDTLRGIEGLERLKGRIPDDRSAFDASPDAESLRASIPLSPMEQKVLSLVNGERTVGNIVNAVGLDRLTVYKHLYLLACFGLIRVAGGKGKAQEEDTGYAEIINIYLDLLGIIENNFRKEVGREFESVFEKCRDELTGESKEIFHGVNLLKDNKDSAGKEIYRRFESLSKAAEGRLVLLASFNKLLFLLIMSMRKVLGVGLAEKTLKEMMNIMDYVEKYRQDTEITNYVKGNLDDYLRQLES